MGEYFFQMEIYMREIKDSQFNGKGKLKSNNEDYEGDFVDGEKTGKGKITFKDGTIYEGNLNKGEFKGNGHMIWKNGYDYSCEFNGPLLNGKGKLTCPEGDVYEGDFKIIYFMGKENIFLVKIGMNMKENFNMELKREKVFILLINILMMDIGIMIYLVVSENLKLQIIMEY